MVEVANLTVKLSADVENALSGMKKSDQALQKSAAVTGKESKKIDGFMGKWKMGWIAVGTAAIAGLYALAKSSAVLGSYLSEYGAVLGAFFDTIFLAFDDTAFDILDKMWELEEKFEQSPKWVQQLTGALLGLAIAIPTLLIMLAAIKWSLATLGLTGLLSTLIIAKLALILFAFTVGTVLGLFAVWILKKTGVLDAIEVFGAGLRNAHPDIMAFVDMLLLPLTSLGAIVSAIVHGEPSRIPEYLKANFDRVKPVLDEFERCCRVVMDEVERAFKAGLDRIVATAVEFERAFKAGLDKIHNTWTAFKKEITMTAKAIGEAIWKPIEDAYNKIKDFINKIIRKIKSIPGISSVASHTPSVPSFQHGGYVPATGLVMLHAGEHVIPTGGTTKSSVTTINFNPTFNIRTEVRSDADLARLADKLSVLMKDRVRRIIR